MFKGSSEDQEKWEEFVTSLLELLKCCFFSSLPFTSPQLQGPIYYPSQRNDQSFNNSFLGTLAEKTQGCLPK